jgi:hypothetical protein
MPGFDLFRHARPDRASIPPNSRKPIGPTRSVGPFSLRQGPISAPGAREPALYPRLTGIALRLFGENAIFERFLWQIAEKRPLLHQTNLLLSS